VNETGSELCPMASSGISTV